MFVIADAKKNCPDITSHPKAEGWITAANSYIGSKRLENAHLSTESVKREAIAFANTNYVKYQRIFKI